MTTMIKQHLSQKLLQKLSPQQIQLMKLLQVPTAVLDQRIKEELETNPALEEGNEEEAFEFESGEEGEYEDFQREDEDSESETPEREDNFELDDYLNDYIEDDPSAYHAQESGRSEDETRQSPLAVENSFHEYLERQLGLLNLKDETELAIALQIIGSIDDDGYLRRDPVSIIDDLMFSQSIITTEKEVYRMLNLIQRLEPAGVGAKDLRECLLLQLRARMERSETLSAQDRTALSRAYQVIDQYFEAFSKKHFSRLTKQLDITDGELKAAIDMVLKLNPKPASGYTQGAGDGANYVVPDFIIQNRDGELELTLNVRNAPELRVSDHYKDMLRAYSRHKEGSRIDKKEREAVLFIKQKIDAAKWFIDAIHKRQTTMYKTMYAIMQFQYEYFLSGDDRRIKPMILKDISDITGLDLSTVSRVASSKFVQTEFGTKRLKDFFSESIVTQDGDEVSTLEVKQTLNDMIRQEDKRKPLSDEDLKELLKERGYNIARRTIAKYREQLNISVARLRKEL